MMKKSVLEKLTMFVMLLCSVFVWQSCSEDDTPPADPLTLEVLEVVDGNNIKLVFNKKVDSSLAEVVSNYTLQTAGSSVSPQSVKVSGQVVILTLENKLLGGDYTVNIKNLKAEDGGVFKAGDVKGFTHEVVWKKVENLPVKSTVAMFGDNPTPEGLKDLVFYSLEKNEVVTFDNMMAEAPTSDKWDIIFNLDGLTMAIVSNTSYVFGKGNARIYATDTPLSEVTNVEKDRTENELISSFAGGGLIAAESKGLIALGAIDVNPWCVKDAENYVELNKQDDTSTPFKLLPKTILFQTASGKYGKMQIQSIYKDNKAPKVVPKDYEYSLTFRYVIQEDGTDNVDIPIDVD